jgi:hypothetical protein
VAIVTPAAGGTVTVTIADACGSQSVFESASWIAVQSSTPEQVTLTIDACHRAIGGDADHVTGAPRLPCRRTSGGATTVPGKYATCRGNLDAFQ